METTNKVSMSFGRLESLDAFRGFTMILLVSEGFGITNLLGYPFLGFIAKHFTHHEWHGMHFWDLVQPFFMFIVGVAMPYSFAKRWEKGDTWNQTFFHALRRSITLLLLGMMLACGWKNKLTLELWNVLCQLSFTYLVAFLFLRKSIRTQLVISFAFLLVYYFAYRFIPVPGVINPWEKDHNLGAFMDMIIVGKLSPGSWITIGCVSLTAHTIWGAIIGTILRSDRTEKQKMKILAISGLIGIVLGLALDPITPIVKRICTSSFVIFSGGWSILFLLLFYWIIDIKGYKKMATIYGDCRNESYIYLYVQWNIQRIFE